ncbi:C2H2 finger domain protein [Aspergillus sp. HF37]|nr:C2H2 finger domain protein [Aspergillus sp. HF37]
MRTVSPQLIQNQSPGDSIVQPPTIQDPYLSAPSDPDEDFRSTGIRYPSSQGEGSDQHPTPDGSSPYSDLQTNGGPARGTDSLVGNSDPAVYPTGSSHNFLSPSDLSAHTPSNDGSLTGGLAVGLDSGQNDWQHGFFSPASAENPPASGTASPNRFNSPSEAQLALHNALSPGSGQPHRQMPRISTGAGGNSLSVQDSLDPDSARARSPIVKIESYSRGDSPVRGSCRSVRRHSQSSIHLSPGNANESSSESEEEETRSEYAHSVPRAEDGSWVPDAQTGHAGVDPASRSDVHVPSPCELQTQRQLDDKKVDIHVWSASVSAANSDAGDETPGVRARPRQRRRAISAGDPSRHQDYFNFKLRVNDSSIPGPGLLLDESSNGDFSERESELGSRSVSPVASVDQTAPGDITCPELQNLEEVPSPNQFIRSRRWQNLGQDAPPQIMRTKPQSSNAAITEYNQCARDIETISHVATFGTDRLSMNFDNMSLHEKSKERERRSSFFKFQPMNALKRYIPHSNGDGAANREGAGGPQRKDSSTSTRKLSLGGITRPHQRSPSLSTRNAFMAIGGQMAAIGGRGSVGGRDSVGAAPSSGESGSRSGPRKNRERSRSEIPKGSVPGLAELMTNQGGPPVAGLAYPAKTEGNNARQMEPGSGQDAGDDEEEGEDDTAGDNRLVMMEFPPVSRLPVPTLEGFKTQVAQLNPRLGPGLIDRFANEQLRRYKELVEAKSSHSHAARNHRCMAGKYCFIQGGNATLLPPRASPQDTNVAPTQFQIAGTDEVGDDAGDLSDGAVTPAQFPIGVPLPPAKRLPAEFECPVCFKVRKFQKPSDWTKHIHEDVQPFTCTFDDCTEPKSFKRKADWVRHENERHRKLEWWTCTITDCHHTCYRKDNFVQHLVREHKMPEPKPKKTKAKGQNGMANGNTIAPDIQDEELWREQELERLWDLVERCRQDTIRAPNSEPCRFCGNICGSWKKLTVHLAKHLEQIALPVLQLVRERDFPLNADAGPLKDAHPIPGPATMSAEPSNPGPYQGEAQNGSVMGVNVGQEGYVEQAESAVPPHYPPMITMQNGVMSAEPEPMDSCDMYQGPQLNVPGASGPSVNQAAQFWPTQQNSVTYPPPFNAVPRPRSNQEMGFLQNPYQVTMSPPEMGSNYGTQAPYYMPTAAGSNYPPHNPSVQASPYDPSGGADYLEGRGANYM